MKQYDRETRAWELNTYVYNVAIGLAYAIIPLTFVLCIMREQYYPCSIGFNSRAFTWTDYSMAWTKIILNACSPLGWAFPDASKG